MGMPIKPLLSDAKRNIKTPVSEAGFIFMTFVQRKYPRTVNMANHRQEPIINSTVITAVSWVISLAVIEERIKQGEVINIRMFDRYLFAWLGIIPMRLTINPTAIIINTDKILLSTTVI